MDFLGAISGVEDLLFALLVQYFGAFAEFNSLIAVFNSFMTTKEENFGISNNESEQ